MTGSLKWRGLTIGTVGDDLFWGGGIDDFGHGSHRNASPEREGGGALGGRIVPASKTYVADAWTDSPAKAAQLRGAMAAVPDPSAVEALEWEGLGWPSGRFAAFVRPTGHGAAGDWLADGDRPAIGLRCSWFSADPTVYSAAETSFTGETAASYRTFSWTNPGTLDPLPGLGGRQWVLAITAATTVRTPFVEIDGLRVRWAGLTLSPGQTLRVGHDRHTWVGSAPVDGFLRQGSSGQSVDVLWPTFPPQRSASMLIGNSSGTFTFQAGVRGTW